MLPRIPSIPISEKLLKKLKKNISRPREHLVLHFTKAELKDLTPLDLAFITMFPIEYYRGSRRLNPASIENFLLDKKYLDTDKAEVIMSLEDLLETGVLHIVRTDSGPILFLGEDPLDPKQYWHLYTSLEFIKTVLYACDLGEIYEKYWYAVEPPEPTEREISDYGPVLAKLVLNKVNYYITENGILAKTSLAMRKDGSVERVQHSGTNRVHVFVLSDNVSADEIEKMEKFITAIEIIVEDVLFSMTRILSKDADIKVNPNQDIYATVKARNYKINSISFIITHRNEKGIIIKDLNIEYILSRTHQNKSLGEYTISMETLIKSSSLGAALKEIGEVKIGIGDGITNTTYSTTHNYMGAGLKYTATYKNTPIPPPLYRPAKILENTRSILENALWERLQEIRGRKLYRSTHHVYTSYSVGKVLDIIKWGRNLTLDEAIIKLLTLKEGLHITRPNLYSILLAHTVLQGHSEKQILGALNNPVDYLVNAVLKNKLKLRARNGELEIIFSGKRLDDIIDTKHPLADNTVSMIMTVFNIALEEEELKRIRKLIHQK